MRTQPHHLRPRPASLSVCCWEMGTREGRSHQGVCGSWASWRSQGDPWENPEVPRQRAPGGGPAAARAALPGAAPRPVSSGIRRASGAGIMLSAIWGQWNNRAGCPILLFAADDIVPWVSFPHRSGNTNVLVFRLLYFFILLWYKLMLLSSQTLAHPGALGGRVLPAAGEGPSHTPAGAHPGLRHAGARRDGPHGQGPSHHLPVHSCRSLRSALRRCNLPTCEDVAAASHMPGPRHRQT